MTDTSIPVRLHRLALAALALLAVGLGSCASTPHLAPVAVVPLEADRYLGTWYEIARIDFFFEKDIDNTSATYTANPDGTIGVRNRGFKYLENRWDEARGTARFRGDRSLGALEVSFFGPFFAAYNVVFLDDGYRHALVAGGSRDYLWLLSRDKSPDPATKDRMLALATEMGYDLSRLTWVRHDKTDPGL